MTPQRANVILAILGLTLVGTLVLAFVRNARAKEARAQTLKQLKEMGTAINMAHDQNKVLPPAFDRYANISYPVSIHVHLLPFVGQEELYKGFAQQGAGNEQAPVSAFISAADHSMASTNGVQNFAANLRTFSKKGWDTNPLQDMPALAAVEPGKFKFGQMQGGTSSVIAFATKFALCGQGGSRYAADPTSPFAAFFGQNSARRGGHASDPRAAFQLAPNVQQCCQSPLMAQSFDNGHLCVVYVDSSTHTIAPDIDPVLWSRLLDPLGRAMSD